VQAARTKNVFAGLAAKIRKKKKIKHQHLRQKFFDENRRDLKTRSRARNSAKKSETSPRQNLQPRNKTKTKRFFSQRICFHK
jgi:hypothetical protein